jgi:hypothetical protein
MVADFEGISVKMSEPGADMDALMGKMDRLQVGAGQAGGPAGRGVAQRPPSAVLSRLQWRLREASRCCCRLLSCIHTHACLLQAQLDACNGWEVDRQLDQAMDALR